MEPDQRQRLRFKRVTLLMLLIPTGWYIAAYLNHIHQPKLILGALIALTLGAMILSNKIAVWKFGDVERKEQEVAAHKRRKNREELVASKAYQKREFARKKFFVLFIVLAPSFCILAAVAIHLWRVSDLVAYNIAAFGAYGVAQLVSQSKAEKKFGRVANKESST